MEVTIPTAAPPVHRRVRGNERALVVLLTALP